MYNLYMKKIITVVLKFLAYIMIFVLANLAVSGGYTLIFKPTITELTTNLNLMLTLSVLGTLLSALVGKVIYQLWSTKQPKRSWFLNVDKRHWRWIIISMLGFSVVASNIVQSLLPFFPDYQEVSNLLSGAYFSWWLMLLLVIIGPIVEELFLRGVVMNDFMSEVSPGVAIVLQAMLFGIIHLNVIQSIYATLGGILLGCFYYYTKSLKAAIVGHIFLNFTGVFGALVISLTFEYPILRWTALLVALVLMIGPVFKMRQISQEREVYEGSLG